ncbi:MAG: DUF4157 domain-containing protein [Phycisphaeraceae bacterium]|nr:MAG: DUF4157 domain-containing protein [Phycisphaeraceae bacterium]
MARAKTTTNEGHDTPTPPRRTKPFKGTNLQLADPSLHDVRVHHEAYKPTGVQAQAYATGHNIHLGPGQDKHLPHEAWHVVQQKQGRVKPTRSL